MAIILAIISLPAYFRMPQDKRQRFNRLMLLGTVLILVSRFLPGLLGLIVPLIAALIAGLVRFLPVLIRYAPLLHRFWLSWKQQSNSTTGHGTPNSIIETPFLRIQLDHTGQPISAEVIAGSLSGRIVTSLNTIELTQLMKQCASDKLSMTLLQLLIQQKSDSYSSHQRSSRSHRRPNTTGRMTVEQAYKVLGIKSNASRKEIITAHRRLIQKAHPDHGGSDALAAQINEARDVLLKTK